MLRRRIHIDLYVEVVPGEFEPVRPKVATRPVHAIFDEAFSEEDEPTIDQRTQDVHYTQADEEYVIPPHLRAARNRFVNDLLSGGAPNLFFDWT